MTPQETARQWLGRQPLFLDTETTGLEADADIIELALVEADGSVVINTLIKPSVPITPQSQAVHGLTDAMVANAPTWREVGPVFEALSKNRLIVIYNADFDVTRIEKANERYGLRPWTMEAVCAMKLYAHHRYGAYWRGKRMRWFGLAEACRNEGVPVSENAHRAYYDCVMTANLIKALANN